MKRTKKTETKVTHTLHLSEEDVRKAVDQWFTDVSARVLPDSTEITAEVPGGGNWSGQRLSIDEFGGLRVQWVTCRETEEEL